jgi:hypothetical protein
MKQYGLSTTDALVKVAIELAVEDLIKYPYIIEHMYSSYFQNPILSKKYGYKEVARAKEFLLNTKINYYLKHRLGTNIEFPAVTISLSQSAEDKQLATLGDLSPEVIEYNPSEIDRPISYIIKPTQIVSYDPITGIMEIGENENYKFIESGMTALDPDTGNGYKIIEKAGNNGFRIQTDLTIDFEKVAIAPQFLTYRARMERIISQESYSIGCHCHGDPSLTHFLYNLVKYALLRYREGLFEQFNFQLGTISATDTIENEAFGSDNVFSRFITLSGQVEEYWVKSPFRTWETIVFDDKDGDLKTSGIKIISNITDGSEEDLWTTVEDNEE